MGGTLGGNLKVFKTGSVDAGFEWPVDSFEAGPLTFEVSAPTTVLSYPSMAGGLASGLRPDGWLLDCGRHRRRLNHGRWAHGLLPECRRCLDVGVGLWAVVARGSGRTEAAGAGHPRSAGRDCAASIQRR